MDERRDHATNNNNIQLYKHPQCERLRREAEEDSWISGEELKTDGSSEEDNAKANKTSKKTKIRKKSKGTPPSSSKSSESAQESKKETPVGSESEIKWRPKRGSLTLPNLFEERKIEAQLEFLNEIAAKVNSLEYLNLDEFPEEFVQKSNQSKSENDAKIKEMFMRIEELENRLKDETNLLQVEKIERLKMQEEVCQEIFKDDQYYNDNSEMFLNMCHYEETEHQSEGSDENDDNNLVKNAKSEQKSSASHQKSIKGKNFIRRNIELASKAMSNQPLTDEEKHKLQQLLSDTELFEAEIAGPSADNLLSLDQCSNNGEDDGNDEGCNAFQVSDQDRQRIGEIDSKLNADFPETKSLKLQSSENENNFWCNLVPEQALKDIDRRLAEISDYKDAENINIDMMENSPA